jgi:hypothetical protein
MGWVREKSWVLLGAVFFALAGVAVDRFSDEINAWVRSIFIGGISGTYVLKTFTYQENATELTPSTNIITLKDTGKTVFGVVRDQDSDEEYRLFGYRRMKFLAMSFGGTSQLGEGTLTLQADIENRASLLFWGWSTTIECFKGESFFEQCPALMYLQGTPHPEEQYSQFLQVGQCKKVDYKTPLKLCDAQPAQHPLRAGAPR